MPPVPKSGDRLGAGALLRVHLTSEAPTARDLRYHAAGAVAGHHAGAAPEKGALGGGVALPNLLHYAARQAGHRDPLQAHGHLHRWRFLARRAVAPPPTGLARRPVPPDRIARLLAAQDPPQYGSRLPGNLGSARRRVERSSRPGEWTTAP